MNIDELIKLKADISNKIKGMNTEELKKYYSESFEWFTNKVGKENFHSTDKPNIFKHTAKKTDKKSVL